MPSLLPSVAAAAGEILGELRQRFMSSLPAGGRACEAETGKSHNGQDCQVARLPGCQVATGGCQVPMLLDSTK